MQQPELQKNNIGITTILISIVTAVSALGYIDRNAKHFESVFQTPGLSGFVLYFIPILILTWFVYKVFIQRVKPGVSLLLAVVVGVPASFLFSGFFLNLITQA